MRARYLLAFLGLLCLISSASAAQYIQQSGTVTPGHAGVWVYDGILGDAGTSVTPQLNTLGIYNGSSPPFCISSQTSPGTPSGAYYRMCDSMSTAGAAKIDIEPYGGATNPTFSIVIDGVVYPFPGTGTGDVTGPTSSVATDLSCFYDTSGKIIDDCGPIGGSEVATQTANYTVVAGVKRVPVNTATGNITITVPESLGTATQPYDVRVFKTSSDTNYVIISADGVTPYAYIVSQNDAGGAGYLDVEVNGSSIRVFGNP